MAVGRMCTHLPMDDGMARVGVGRRLWEVMCAEVNHELRRSRIDETVETVSLATVSAESSVSGQSVRCRTSPIGSSGPGGMIRHQPLLAGDEERHTAIFVRVCRNRTGTSRFVSARLSISRHVDRDGPFVPPVEARARRGRQGRRAPRARARSARGPSRARGSPRAGTRLTARLGPMSGSRAPGPRSGQTPGYAHGRSTTRGERPAVCVPPRFQRGRTSAARRATSGAPAPEARESPRSG